MKQIYKNILLASLCIIPVIFYYTIVFRYAINIPHSDDFGAIIDFINKYSTANIDEKLYSLISRHSDHRILMDRLFTIVDYYIFGKVNLTHLIILGNVALLFVLWSLFKIMPPTNNRLFYFLPIPYFLLQLQHWENIGYAMASIQNFYIFVFSIWSLYFLSLKTKHYFTLALIFASVATFTSGNGLLTFIVGIIILIVQQRYKKELIIWLGVGSLNIYVYFHNHIYSQPTLLSEILITKPDIISSAFFSGLANCIILNNNWEAPQYTYFVSFVLGISITIFYVFLIYFAYHKTNPLLFSIVTFLIITIALLSLIRSPYYGTWFVASSSRYKIISTILFIIIYLIILDLIKEKVNNLVIIFLTILLAYFNWNVYLKQIGVMDTLKDALYKTSYMYYKKQSLDAIIDSPDAIKSVKKIMETAMKRGLYKMPDLSDNYIKATTLSNLVKLDIKTNYDSLMYKIDFLTTSDKSFYSIRDGWALIKGQHAGGSKVYIVLKSDDKTYIFDTQTQYRNDVVELMKKKYPSDTFNYLDAGFSFKIPRNTLKPNTYKVNVYLVNGDKKVLKFIDKIIDTR